MKLTLKRKIYGLAILAAGLPVVALLGMMAWSQSRIIRESERELTSLASFSLNHSARNIYSLCQNANSLTQAKVDYDLRVAYKLLAAAGKVSLSNERVPWQTVNQFSQQQQEIAVPRMMLGSKPLPKTQDFQTPLPVVDELKQLVGSDATIFERISPAGDMLRVATTISSAPGRRGVGTFIPAVNPDGTPNAVITKLMSGQKYLGIAYAVNRWFVSAYDPMRDASGNIIGNLFVGEEVSGLEELKRTLHDMAVGKTGWVSISTAKGASKGKFVIPPPGRTEADTDELAAKQLDRAIASSPGEVFFNETYQVRDASGGPPHNRIAAMTYFAPWDWLITASIDEDEYHSAVTGVKKSVDTLMIELVVAGLLALGVALAIAFGLSSKLTRPLTLLTSLASKIASGDMAAAKTDLSARDLAESNGRGSKSDSADETGELLHSFRTMTHTLDGLIGQVQRSGIQVTASATQIAASARQLEAAIAEQAASTREVSGTTKQISATSTELLRSITNVSDAVSDTAARAESGRTDLSRMETEMRSLAKATASVSSRLNIINDRAAKISTVITTINHVSEQTTLLSLNAAIEAEKAGEYGRGFSVVAREISRLADQTAAATQDIEVVVKEMQSSVSTGVMEMDKFSEEVRRRVEDVNTLGDQLGGMIDCVRALGPEFEAAREGMNAQNQGAQQISEATLQLSQSADQTRESLTEFKDAAEQLNAAVQGLQGQVSRFRLSV
jgi:methyl-accepting chemotaxis protein WspA